MVDVKWSSPTDLTVSGGATYTQADLDAALDRAKREARVEALGWAAEMVDQKYIALGRYGLRDAIRALIEKEKAGE